jgi:hypothetical protein
MELPGHGEGEPPIMPYPFAREPETIKDAEDESLVAKC